MGSMRRDDQLALLRQNVRDWNAWRGEHPDEELEFIRADLRSADLRGADLRGADLTGADLTHAALITRVVDRRGLVNWRYLLRVSDSVSKSPPVCIAIARRLGSVPCDQDCTWHIHDDTCQRGILERLLPLMIPDEREHGALCDLRKVSAKKFRLLMEEAGVWEKHRGRMAA